MSTNPDSHHKLFDWEAISPSDFENLVFFLLDEMGFKNIEWRKGGEGISSTDGGRDLEAVLTIIEPGDLVRLEKWWVEVKYRSHNLSPTIVKESILNALGREGVNVFAIITTGTISNKTLDWIKEFERSEKQLRIRVWQLQDLERVLGKYPQTATKYFYKNLPPNDLLRAVRNRFFNSSLLPTLDEIDYFWENFSSLNWNGESLLPFVISETLAGYPEFRQWGLVADEKLLMETLVVGLANVPQLVVRFNNFRKSNESLITGLAYLLEMCLLRIDLDRLLKFIANPYQLVEGNIEAPTELLSFIWRPVLSQMYRDLGENCSQDCSKVSWKDDKKNRPVSYFNRFVKSDQIGITLTEEPFVVIQLSEFKCKLGIIPDGEYCPLSEEISEDCGNYEKLNKWLAFAQIVIRMRAEYLSKNEFKT